MDCEQTLGKDQGSCRKTHQNAWLSNLDSNGQTKTYNPRKDLLRTHRGIKTFQTLAYCT